MFLVFHEIFRLAVLINFVLIKKKECTRLSIKRSTCKEKVEVSPEFKVTLDGLPFL